MKNVVLIGDSIRMGYQETVVKELKDHATVWGPAENGGTSENVLAHLDEWVISRNPNIVHINCGLHDIKKGFGETKAAVPIDVYEQNIRTIMTRVKNETDATVIWALTTPVIHEWHHEHKEFDRFETDVYAYNAVAINIARELTISLNDLFAAVARKGCENIQTPDGVHYIPEGYSLLGQTVAEYIRKVAETNSTHQSD